MTEITVDERLAALERENARRRAPIDPTAPQDPIPSQANAERQQRQERERQDRLRAAGRAEERASLEARRLAPQIEAAESACRAIAERIEQEHARHADRLAELATEQRGANLKRGELHALVAQAGRDDLSGEE